jgi:hypothetical protein
MESDSQIVVASCLSELERAGYRRSHPIDWLAASHRWHDDARARWRAEDEAARRRRVREEQRLDLTRRVRAWNALVEALAA